MPQTVDQRLHCISTIILSEWTDVQSSATGFFFQQLSPPEPEKQKAGQGYWRTVEGLWLVTNRHVLVNGGQLATSIKFHHRKLTTNGFEWLPITILGDDLKTRCTFHQDDTVDVAIVSVSDLLVKAIHPAPDNEKAMIYTAVSEEDFPKTGGKITVEVGDDALVVGYPRGFYDKLSKFPIVKSGVIASFWGMPFGGKPYFLIDAKLFPGSSGSIVISKPIGYVIENKQILHPASGSKQFAFLGIFSGEPISESRPIETDGFTIISKEGYGLGIVWYFYLVTDIIKNGKRHDNS